MIISGGTYYLLSDEVVVYPSEEVSADLPGVESRGVLVCASRAGLGSRTGAKTGRTSAPKPASAVAPANPSSAGMPSSSATQPASAVAPAIPGSAGMPETFGPPEPPPGCPLVAHIGKSFVPWAGERASTVKLEQSPEMGQWGPDSASPYHYRVEGSQPCPDWESFAIIMARNGYLGLPLRSSEQEDWFFLTPLGDLDGAKIHFESGPWTMRTGGSGGFGR